MRVCPKCGYQDPPYWRHSKHSYWIDFTEYENFALLHPELAKKLEAGKNVEDELYVYHRTRSGIKVERKAKIDYGNQMRIPMEKVDIHNNKDYWKRLPRGQRKLVGEEKTTK